MKKFIFIIAVLVVAQWWIRDPSISVPSNDVSFSYIVEYTGNGRRNDSLPMLVALHGNGDTAKHFFNTALNQLNVSARVVLIKGPLTYGRGDAWPWSEADFERYGDALNEAIVSLSQKFSTKNKPILLGFSGGGMMAYYQAITHGDSYSYIFPISGRLSKELIGDHEFKTGAKVIAFHGRNDGVVSISGGRKAMEILSENGVNSNLIEFDGGHLGIFENMKPDITKAIETKVLMLSYQ